MDGPRIAPGWPGAPIDEDRARALLDGDLVAESVHAVWVRRDADAGTGGVVDVVCETDAGFRVFAYAPGPEGRTWLDHGRLPARAVDAADLRDRLDGYDLVAGESRIGRHEPTY